MIEMDPKQFPFYDACMDLPKGKDEKIKQLRSWMATQPHLPQISDGFLHVFLFSNYDDVEKAQSTIEIYFTSRASHPELFTNRSPRGPDLQSVFDMMYIVPLEKKTPEGYRVGIVKYYDCDLAKFNHLNIIKTMNFVYEVMLWEDPFCEGYVMVTDMTGTTFSHFLKQNFSIARANMKYVQEGVPIRLKGFHILHAPSFMDTMFNIMRPFLKKELLDLVRIHQSDFTEFYKDVPREIVPKDYGGPNESMQVLHEKLIHKLKTKYEDWADNENEPKADMSKHPNNTKKSFFSFW